MNKLELEKYLSLAIAEANLAVKQGNAPFGAVAVSGREIIAKAHNTVNTSCDPTAHAEINLLRRIAKKTGKTKFNNISVFINSEPCSMCSSALIRSGISIIYYGSSQETEQSLYIPIAEIAERASKKIKIVKGILEDKSQKLVKGARKKLK